MPVIFNDGIQNNSPKPLDSSYGRFVAGAFRPFTDVAEANTFTTYRYIGKTVYVGTTSNYAEYAYRGGTADNNLVLKSAGGTTDASQLTSGTLPLARITDGTLPTVKLSQTSTIASVNNNNTIQAWGDSLTLGSGGSVTTEYPTGTPWMVYLRDLTGFNFFNGGVGGNDSTQIKTRFLADTAKRAWPAIFWAGANDPTQQKVLDDLAAMVAALGHQRYLVISLTGQNTFPIGSGTYNQVHNTNVAVAAVYGQRWVDVRSALVAAYDPSLAQDVIDHGNDVVPTSLLYPGDATHFNDKGYRVIANAIAAKIAFLYSTAPADNTVLTSGTVNTLFGAPLGIGVTTPNVGAFTNIALNAPLTDATIVDAAGINRRLVGEIKGALHIMHPTPSAGTGGIYIKPKYENESGYSSLEISGTSSFWTPGKGLAFNNYNASVIIGTNTSVTGNIAASGQLSGGTLLTGRAEVLSIGNIGQFVTPRRVAEFQNPGGSLNGGIILPILSNSTLPGITDAREGEVAYNASVHRPVAVVPDPIYPPNGMKWENLAFQTDIVNPTFFNGAGISITGSLSAGFTIANTTVPATAKIISSTYICNNEPNPTGAGRERAFDGNLTTFYQAGPESDAFVGLDFGSAYILTKFKIKPSPGLVVTGCKIQGCAAGVDPYGVGTTWVDLYTLTNIDTTGAFFEFPIASILPFRYGRILAGSVPPLAVAELEFYGYQSPEVSVDGASPLTYNTSTKVLGMPAATNSVPGFLTAADHTTFAAKQAALVSATNIKTINGASVMGSGDLTVGTSDASTLTTGTIPDARHSANVVMLTGTQTLVSKTLTAPIINNATIVTNLDIEVTDLTKGIILKSPDGTRWRYTASNTTGALVATSL